MILNNEFIGNYDRSLIRTDFMLTDSGKYYLEIYKSQYPQYNIKEGYFIPVLADTLIDIINLRIGMIKLLNYLLEWNQIII